MVSQPNSRRRYTNTRLDQILAGLRAAFILAGFAEYLFGHPAPNSWSGIAVSNLFWGSVLLAILFAMVRGQRWAVGLGALQFLLFTYEIVHLVSAPATLAYSSILRLDSLYAMAFSLYCVLRYFGAFAPVPGIQGLLAPVPSPPIPVPSGRPTQR